MWRTFTGMVQFHRYAPPEALRPFIACVEVIAHDGPVQTASAQRVTPDGCMELNFNLGDPLLRITTEGAQQLTGAYVVCRHARPYFVQRTGPAFVISVRFHPWGAPRLPLHELADAALDAVDVFGPMVRNVHQRLLRTTHTAHALAQVHEFLVGALRASTVDALVVDAAQRLSEAQGSNALHDLQQHYGLSARRLQQRFQHQLGMAPKAFMRLMRFQRALRSLHRGSSCMDVAFDQGYSDQSHLVREFKAFAGIPPFRYRREAHPLNDAMLLERAVG
ncbi:MAG: AraC family transcriptional regulator [Flavobacteriales bacterium]|nr:AraC family transcriptional regulator [Flavobacteriales bacterium]